MAYSCVQLHLPLCLDSRPNTGYVYFGQGLIALKYLVIQIATLSQIDQLSNILWL